MITGRAWLRDAIAAMADHHLPEARLEGRIMLADALGTSLGALSFHLDDALSDDARSRADRWLAARLAGSPLQYAQNRAYFMGETFYVDPRVLIPRQDTELLCERGLAALPIGGSFLELCTGSGALAATVAKRRPDASVTATDLSFDALAVAKINAENHGVSIEFLQGDFLEPVAGRRFDVICVNPPYLTDADMQTLQPEVAREPAMALRGGADGLDFYRRAAPIRDYLTPGGRALFEVGAGQAETVAAILRGASAIYDDLGGIRRVVAVTA